MNSTRGGESLVANAQNEEPVFSWFWAIVGFFVFLIELPFAILAVVLMVPALILVFCGADVYECLHAMMLAPYNALQWGYMVENADEDYDII